MAHYRRIGTVPPKRHTQHRDPEGRLYHEELMGEEGFSSDSSLLYHRGVPSAIVASEVWELPDQSRTPNHPLKPRHLKLHDLETGTDPVTGIEHAVRQMVFIETRTGGTRYPRPHPRTIARRRQ